MGVPSLADDASCSWKASGGVRNWSWWTTASCLRGVFQRVCVRDGRAQPQPFLPASGCWRGGRLQQITCWYAAVCQQWGQHTRWCSSPAWGPGWWRCPGCGRTPQCRLCHPHQKWAHWGCCPLQSSKDGPMIGCTAVCTERRKASLHGISLTSLLRPYRSGLSQPHRSFTAEQIRDQINTTTAWCAFCHIIWV